MAKVVYTAEATVTGGREQGHGKTSDGALDVQLRPPNEGGGTNPEQLFAVGYAACFEGALGVAARRAKAEVGDASIDSKVSLVTTEDRGYHRGGRARRDAATGAGRRAGRRRSSRRRTRSARTRTRPAATSRSR